MKRIVPLLLLALCLCTGALASESAATAVRTGLYDAPRDGAQELMRYYTGTRVEACFMCLRSCSPKPVVHSTSGSDCFMQ